MKCLIGESKRAPRSFLTKLLRSIGHEVDLAEDGEEILDNLDEKHQIIFIASNIPKRSGLEMVKEIRDLEGEFPYLFLSISEDEKEELVPALESGVDDFLVKPYSKDQVIARVKKAERMIKGRETFEEFDFDPIYELEEEHKTLERMVNIFQVIVSNLGEKRYEKILNWIADSTFKVDTKLHHEKERYLLMFFLENAIKEQGEVSESKLFNRASLKSVDKEHEELEKVIEEIQGSISEHLQNDGDIETVKEKIDSYTSLVSPHIDREERFLFPLAKKYLYNEDISELKSRFDSIDEEVSDRLEKLPQEMQKAEKILGI